MKTGSLIKIFLCLLILAGCSKKSDKSDAFEIQSTFSGSITIDSSATINEEIIKLKEKVKTNSDDPNSYQNIAELSYEKRNLEEAILNAEQAVKIKPNLVEGYLTLAQSWFDKENYPLSKEYFIKALMIDEKIAEAHFGLANCLYVQNEFDLAIEEYKIAIDLKPDYISALHNLGGLLLHTGKYKESLQYSLKAIQFDASEMPTAYLNAAMAYEKLQDKKNATEYYERYLDFDPFNDDVKLWIKELE